MRLRTPQPCYNFTTSTTRHAFFNRNLGLYYMNRVYHVRHEYSIVLLNIYLQSRPAMRNLWDEALGSLPDDERAKLNIAQADEDDILRKVLAVVEERKEKCIGRQWKVKKPDGSEVV